MTACKPRLPIIRRARAWPSPSTLTPLAASFIKIHAEDFVVPPGQLLQMVAEVLGEIGRQVGRPQPVHLAQGLQEFEHTHFFELVLANFQVKMLGHAPAQGFGRLGPQREDIEPAGHPAADDPHRRLRLGKDHLRRPAYLLVHVFINSVELQLAPGIAAEAPLQGPAQPEAKHPLLDLMPFVTLLVGGATGQYHAAVNGLRLDGPGYRVRRQVLDKGVALPPGVAAIQDQELGLGRTFRQPLAHSTRA